MADAALARRAFGLTGGTAVALVLAYLLAPPMGTDLSAQVARADFFAAHGFAPVDFRWYGGVLPNGYSLVSPPLMAGLGGGLLGAKLAGALAAAVSTVAFVVLLLRTGARRPALAGVLGAVCFIGNLVSGRVTFAVGVAFGLLALAALTAPPDRRWSRVGGTVAGSALAAAASPVAGLFVGLAGVALLLSHRFRFRSRSWDGAWLVLGAAVPLAAMTALSGSGGWMNISRTDTVHAVVTSVAVALLVPRPAVRAGALLSALGVLAAFAVHTPVGLNATRLATMFALPVLAGYADLDWLPRPDRVAPRGWASAGLLVVLALAVWWQPPLLRGDLADAGNPTASPGYFRPLRDELARRAPVGRVEVVPTRDYWEAAYAASAVPLARGWLRQVDLAYHPLFFDGSLSADRYHEWLLDNGVSYVALAGAEPSWVGRAEAALVRGGLPYLAEVWRGGDWVLYQVAGSPSIVDNARLVSSTADRVTVDVPAPGEVLVRVRYSRWLTVQGPGACLARDRDGWTLVRARQAGRFTVSSSLHAGQATCW
jgi:hypothetical protein